jgi:hypothetical protein
MNKNKYTSNNKNILLEKNISDIDILNINILAKIKIKNKKKDIKIGLVLLSRSSAVTETVREEIE